jgi:hypothetical protein
VDGRLKSARLALRKIGPRDPRHVHAARDFLSLRREQSAHRLPPGGNSSKGTGSGLKSDSDFYHDPPREGLGVYLGRVACDRTREGNPAKIK